MKKDHFSNFEKRHYEAANLDLLFLRSRFRFFIELQTEIYPVGKIFLSLDSRLMNKYKTSHDTIAMDHRPCPIFFKGLVKNFWIDTTHDLLIAHANAHF